MAQPRPAPLSRQHRLRRRRHSLWLWLAAALLLALLLAPVAYAEKGREKEDEDEDKYEHADEQEDHGEEDALTKQYQAMKEAAAASAAAQAEKDKAAEQQLKQEQQQADKALDQSGETGLAVGLGDPNKIDEEDEDEDEHEDEDEDEDGFEGDDDAEHDDDDLDGEDGDDEGDGDAEDESDGHPEKPHAPKPEQRSAPMPQGVDKAVAAQGGGGEGKEGGRPAKPPGRPLPPQAQAQGQDQGQGQEKPKGDGEEHDEGDEEDEVDRYEKAHGSGGKGKPWWEDSGEKGGSASTAASTPGGGPQPWQQACEGPWGYEGYANKTGRSGGGEKGKGPKGGFEDEAEFQQRCARFNASVQYVSAFAAENPNATFTVGINNMSDWQPEEVATLYGVKDVSFAPSLVLDMDDAATVEALITGQAAYEEVFGSATGATTQTTVVGGEGEGEGEGAAAPAAPAAPETVAAATTGTTDAEKEAAVDAASTLIGTETSTTDPVPVPSKPSASASASAPAAADATAADALIAPEAPVVDAPADASIPTTISAEDGAGAGAGGIPAPPVPLGVIVEKPADAEADAALMQDPDLVAPIPPAAPEPEPVPEPATEQPPTSGRERRRVLGRALPATSGSGSGGSLVLPAVIDYRYAEFNPYRLAAVTPVKDQGKCGSCWALTTAGMLEGQVALQRNGTTKNLSPQQLVDCDTGNRACNGGRVNDALNYTQRFGLRTLGSYPYNAAPGTCKGPDPTFAYSAGPTFVNPCDERQLQKALYYFGPVAVNVKANCPAFMAYSGGIFTPDKDCVDVSGGPATQDGCANEVDHAVLLVGYGTDKATGLDFWIIKNTWGTSWGEAGYMRLQRNAGANVCGTSCLSAFAVTMVQGFATTNAGGAADGSWADDDATPSPSPKDQTTAEKIVDKVKEIADKAAAALDDAGDAIRRAATKLRSVDVRILAVAGFFGCAFLVAFLYYCCCLRRWRRQRRIRLELERERARWV